MKTLLICEIFQLNYYESKYIRQYNSIAPNGYNLRVGGGSKGRHSEETIEKLKRAKGGVNNHMYGKHHSDRSEKRFPKAIMEK